MDLQSFFMSNIHTGRIEEIGQSACEYYHVLDYHRLSTTEKLQSLCCALLIDADSLDNIIISHSEVKRTIKGHAFEVIFEKMMQLNNIDCIDVGGDGDIDLIVNSVNSQLKTPYVKGCSEGIVSYKTHKTHGAKSEKESFNYYHKVRDFADVLIGLISYTPFRVLVKSASDLPTVPGHSEYIQSPMYFDISGNRGINDFTPLGINKQLDFPQEQIKLDRNEALPLSAHDMEVKSDYILTAIFRPENFRIWDMNMRGFIREWALDNLFQKNNITVYSPTVTGLERPEKSDCVLRKKGGEYIRFQVKGLTYFGCKFAGDKSKIDCETQLSRGRVNDHETQSRLYKKTDFEFVIMAVDPPYTNQFSTECYNKTDYNWSFYCVPVDKLSCHKNYPGRIASHQYITYKELQQYRINKDWLTQWV